MRERPSKLRALIVDDELAARRILQKYCARIGDIEVVAEAADAAGAISAIRQLRPDVVFLDIKLASSDGFQVVTNLSAQELPAIVFVSAFDRFAVRAFEVRALDYLLKPFEYERFRQAVERVRLLLGSGATQADRLRDAARELSEAPLLASGRELRIITEPGRRFLVLRSDEVVVVVADGNYLIVHRGSEQLRTRGTLQMAETALTDVGFLRVHRSVLLNTRYVKELRRNSRGDFEIVLLDDSRWVSSAAYRDAVAEFAHRGLLGVGVLGT